MMENRLVVGDEIPSNAGVIEVHVRDLSQLFNSMDPSPFLDKDLDVDAGWTRELPGDKPLALLVHLDRQSSSLVKVQLSATQCIRISSTPRRDVESASARIASPSLASLSAAIDEFGGVTRVPFRSYRVICPW